MDNLSAEKREILAIMDTDVFIGAHVIYYYNKIHLRMKDVEPDTVAELTNSLILPLKFYNTSFSSVYDEIVTKINSDIPINEAIDSLGDMGYLWFYADLSGILDYYSFPTDMIPNVDSEVISSQFSKLYNLVDNVFKQANINLPNRNSTSVKIDYISKDGFDDRYKKMVWYLYSTDVSWTQVVFAAIKEYLNSISFPSPRMLLTIPTFNLIEMNTKKFFNNYAGGIKSIRDNRKLSQVEYLTLMTTWRMDYQVYTDWLDNHIKYNLVSDDFVDNMEVFIENIGIVLENTEAVI